MDDHLNFIIGYEGGDIHDEQEVIDGFQAMINDSTVWNLQGSYGRTAAALIDAGACNPAEVAS